MNRKRQAKDFPRKYGSVERVEWVKTQPCSACGVVGYSENAHVAPASEKGTGYKAAYEWIVPLCGYQFHHGQHAMAMYIGCHRLRDVAPSDFHRRFPAFNSEKVAAQTEAAWQVYSGTPNKDEE